MSNLIFIFDEYLLPLSETFQLTLQTTQPGQSSAFGGAITATAPTAAGPSSGFNFNPVAAPITNFTAAAQSVQPFQFP